MIIATLTLEPLIEGAPIKFLSDLRAQYSDYK